MCIRDRSTHALSDVAAICDYVVVLAHTRVVLSDDTEYIVETHRIISIVDDRDLALPPGITVIHEQHNARGRSLLVRVELPFNDDRWRVDRPTLEEIVWPTCEKVRPIVMVTTSTTSKMVCADVGRMAPAALHRDCLRLTRRCRIDVGASHGPTRAD